MNNPVPVTVLMPVGPNYNLEWLQEAVKSVFEQTYPVNELLLIDDAAGLDLDAIFGPLSTRHFLWSGLSRMKDYYHYSDALQPINITYFRNFWRLGFSASFNEAVGLSDNELMIYLASDDKLMPDAIADCVETWEQNNRKSAWYSLTYESPDGISDIPINAAMIDKQLWKETGGYPPCAFAGPDALLLSCFLRWSTDRIVRVKPGKVNYVIRKHDQQETKVTAQRYSDEMTNIRNKYTETFSFNPDWVKNL